MPLKDGSRNRWRGAVKWRGQKYRADFKTRREAVEWEAAKRRELRELEKHPTPTGTDLLTFCNEYLDHCDMRYGRKTFREKRSLCRHLLKVVGNIDSEAVTTKLVYGFLTARNHGKSANAFNVDRKNLLAMWNWGKKVFGLTSNPVMNIDRLPHDRAPQQTPSTEDVLKVLVASKPEERIFLNCYLQTGARRSEIFRWTWVEDINFERREVRLGTRKTRDGSMNYEWLPMNDVLHDELWWWWKNRPIKDTPYVFVSTSPRHYGKPFTTRRRFMKGLCERAGVTPFGFHGLRRYVASMLADAHKISAKSIQRILRHKNVTTTERYIQNINRDLADIMNLLHKGDPNGGPKIQQRGQE